MMPRVSPPLRVELPDGSRIERAYRIEAGEKAPKGNWQWAVYNPDRRPTRKRINLRTKDRAAAMSLALRYARDYALGAFDPWTQAAPAGVTVARAVTGYAAAQRQAGRAESTVAAAERMLAAFVRTLPAGTAVEHVEPAHVERFTSAPKHRRAGSRDAPRAKSPATRQRYLAVLSHFFGYCVRRGYTRTNPAAPVEAPPVRPNRRDHVSDPEAAAMLRALDAADVFAATRGDDGAVWLRDWFVFGLGTGLRPGEQRALTFADVRLDGEVATVRVRGTKTTGSARTVPVAGDALAVLRRRVAARRHELADAPVFTGAGGAPVALDFVSKRLQALARAAGLEKNVTAYSLRHSYGTKMAAAGVPLLDLARMMGTSAVMIERHYGHYDPARGASHVARVFGSAEPAREPA